MRIETNTKTEKMINVAIFTHVNAIDGSISFEEYDLRVVSIRNNESLIKNDFDKLWESVNDIETKDLIPEEWYVLEFKRNWEDDGSGSRSQCWFELVEANLFSSSYCSCSFVMIMRNSDDKAICSECGKLVCNA